MKIKKSSRLLALMLMLVTSINSAWADTWVIAGNNKDGVLDGKSWDGTATVNQMTKSGSNWFLCKAHRTVTAGNLEWKAVEGSDWYCYSCGGGNMVTTLTAGTKDILFICNGKKDDIWMTALQVDHWIVAGDEDLVGANWSLTTSANYMTYSDGIYSLTKSNVSLTCGTTYGFKVVYANNSSIWDWAFPSSNYEFTPTISGTYNLTFTFNPTNFTVSLTATPTANHYFIFGNSPLSWTYCAGTELTGPTTDYVGNSYYYYQANGSRTFKIAEDDNNLSKERNFSHVDNHVMRTNINLTGSGTGNVTLPSAGYIIYYPGSDKICAASSLTNLGKPYDITYKDQGDVAFSGSHADGYPTTHSYGTATNLKSASKTGYNFGGWFDNSSCTGGAVTSLDAALEEDITLYAKWTAQEYDITYLDKGGSEFSGTQLEAPTTHTYGTATTLKIPTKTGYNFGGWFTASDCASGAVGDASSASLGATDYTADITLYAKWTAKTTTITYSQSGDGYSTGGPSSTETATYDDDMPAISVPTANNHYAFMGYYDALEPLGTQYYDKDGNSARTWDKEDASATLYAYFKQAEITAITFTGGAVVSPNTPKTVTATIEPATSGTKTVCWRVLYSNDNPMSPQPAFSPSNQGNSVSFTSPGESGIYKIEAVLHSGSGCGGSDLSTYVTTFQVASDHDVTVQYKDASGNVIAASTTVTGKPLEWSSAIDAPDDIFGYTFDHWKAGDGITLSEDGLSALGEDESEAETIHIKATYDGTLTAVYNKKKYIYLDLSQQFGAAAWTAPYVYFYKAAGYWDGSKGTGATTENCVGYGAMTNIDGTDIWYYDYESVSNFGGVIAFTKEDKHTQDNFWETEAIYRGDFSEGTPVFVPLNGQVKTTKNDKCDYYNAGYWVTYFGDETGYTLRIKNNSTDALIKEVPFTSATKRMTMKAVTDLEATHTYKFEIMRDNGKYYKNNGARTYSNRNDNWKYTEALTIGTITTTASGDYTFTLGYADNNNDHDYQLRVNVEYPVKSGDYRLIYKDDVHLNFKPSASIAKSNGGKDTVSFFVRPGQHPILYKQTATVNASTGAVTWATTETNLITAAMLASPITKDSVYNFNLVMADADGALSVGDVKGYTGNFYIRTDGVNNKWDNYTNADHMMTYSEYAEKNSGYSHYFMSYVGNGTNVKFVVANDYSPCISDTLAQATSDVVGGGTDHVDASGFIAADANIRFMWKRSDNTISRKYLAAAKNDGSKFLVLRANSNTDLLDENGNALLQSANSGQAGYNHKVPDNSMQFIDDENWIYETTVKVLPSAYVKLYAHFHGVDQYYKGEANDDFDESNAIQLMTGTGDAEKLHVIYDFKTDRLVSAWTPTGNITTVREINADVMFVREHQGDIQQLTFSKTGETMGAITEIKTAYGVLRFNKWTLNNKSKADGHAVLDPLLSRYERDLFYVSFPFKVAMNEVFGFGTYGVHWIIEEYDGADRAAKGYWADSESFWKFVYDRRGKYFEPNKGYIIALDLDELYYTDADHHSSVWDNNVETVELYFPSYGTMGNITNATVVHTLPEHTCTIGPRFEGGESRTIADSHWNVMSVPTYVNTSSVEFANTDWITEGDGQRGPNFLYEWNPDDNSLTARSGKGYTYHAMHAYMVQYYGNVTWTTTSVTPASVAARLADTPDREYKLELINGDIVEDHTFVRLTDNENVSAGFEFNYDLSKEMNKNRANIYTLISMTIDSLSTITKAAANVQPHPLTTTIVPVGVKIAANGEYTFSMPEGTNGGDVWLIDNANSSRTNLGLMDYTVNLTTGTYEGRFSLEFPVQNVVTEIENAANANANANADDAVRKVFVGGQLYIIRDGVIYNASGARVQ